MTGRPMRDISEGIYDDGEWISWEWINGQIADQEPLGSFNSLIGLSAVCLRDIDGQKQRGVGIDHDLSSSRISMIVFPG
jgi:hypothetical protein